MFFLKKLLLHFRRWRLEELSDLWRVVLWLEKERQAGRGDQAMDQFLVKLTPIVRENVKRYEVLMRELDQLTDGIYSKLDPARNARIGLPAGVTMLGSFEQALKELTPFLDQLGQMDGKGQAQAWRKVLEDPEEYRVFVTRLVQQLGNFELVAMSLPGVGQITINPRTQEILAEMYRINTRHIRLMDIGFSLLRAWHSNPPKASYAFFQTESDIGKLVREMLFEYMIESDPERIAQAADRAKKAGRRMSRYRFWRPAETFRQMARVEYEQTPRRRPKPTREYVALDLAQPVPITVDIQRFEWAMKEVFNNCIAATTQMSVSKQGLIAQPLEKQAAQPDKPAIRIGVQMVTKKVGLFPEQFVRLTFKDEGVGMSPEQGPFAPLWAYSTRRGGTEEKQAKGQLDQADQQELLIGGKGIGLPFARATIMELGGTLDFQTNAGVGTVVTIDLPVNSPLTV